MEKIDFVVTWVDGNDPAWIAEKRKWQSMSTGAMCETGDANADCRYRSDGESLHYWFRAVEKFAPWVNMIHFVTCGQKPEWLDENNPKLHLVDHKDFIPAKFLPTFNANTIEMNLHRLEALSERFVLFNDDMFLLQPVGQDFFFRNGDPVLDTDLRISPFLGYNNWSRFVFNGYCLVNQSFNTRQTIWKNRRKWFNVKALGLKRVRQNLLCYLANKTVPVGAYSHVANPHLKSSLEEVWQKWPDAMDNTSSSKFRTDDKVNQWMLCAWNQAKGRFYPVHEKNRGQNVEISSNTLGWICQLIREQSVPQICINDTQNNDTNFAVSMARICEAFDAILPEKSSFEKY